MVSFTALRAHFPRRAPAGRFASAFILLLISGLLGAASQAATSPVGATAGSFAVSPSGAATYNIPLAVPPGTAGMQPSLSLSYSSQGGNGILELGWNLRGLSQIQRCSKTLAQDGVKGGINFDNNDRFCLDGQRLVAISGVYGADGTTYGTEIESYSKIVSYGVAGSGPAYFKVWTKSGQIMEFGVTADSRIEAQGKTSAMIWALNKVSDTAGNYLTVTYIEDNANGQFYPSRVDYTGNANAGLAPYNSVQFTYETRPYIAPAAYIAGSIVKNTVRLTDIKTFAGATLAREYRPAYNNSLLASLTECAGDGVCLVPTTFGWQLSTGNLQMQAAAWSFPAGAAAVPSDWGESNLALADINGDGLADYVYFSDGPVYAMLSNGKGFNPPTQWGSGGATVAMIRNTGANLLGDINGDGKADFVYIQNGVAYVEISNGNSFSPAVAWATGITLDPAAIFSAWLADVDGDGKADLIYENGGSTYVMLSTGTGFAPAAIWSSGNASAYSGYYGVGGMLSVGAVADVDGDGKADYVYALGSTIYVRLSTGTSFGAPQQWFAGLPGLVSNTLPFSALADVDGDGRADLVFGDSGTTTTVALSNGNGFTAPSSLGVNYAKFVLSTNRIGDIDGDGRADFIYDESSGYPKINLTLAPTPTQLTTITNGLGTVTTVTYKPLTDSTVYTKDSGAVYPVKEVQNQGPIYVVSASSTSDGIGIGGNYQLTYKYDGMRLSMDGRGLLGFRAIDTTDTQTGTVTHSEYRQDYPYIGVPSLSTMTVNGTLVNQTQNTYTATSLGGTSYAILLSQSVASSYELTGSLVTTVTTQTQYDAYGNPTQIVVSTGDGYSKTSNNTYTNDTTNWLLGRLTLATVTSATPSAGSTTRTSSFAYNAAYGLLTQEVIEPNIPALRLQTDYAYDSYGNKKSVTVSGADIATRTSSTSYDSNGQFPVTATNALGQSETRAYAPRFGTPTSLTGPNGLTTTWSYDGFGRKINETRADGTQTNVAFNPCDATCPALAKYYVATTTAAAPTSYSYYDMLNREIRAKVQGFDGRLVTKDTVYDSFGRVDHVSKPYYAGDSPLYAYFQYDALNRVIKQTAPDNSTQQISYNGLTTVSTNALGQTETKAKNSQGQLIRVTDTQSNVVSYQYDPFGNLLKTTDAKANVVTLTYDLRGRKIAMSDPDMGNWSYQYNVLGELVKQTDAKGQIVTMSYDVLGRMLSRSEPDLNSAWVYDTAAKGIGKLAQVSSDNGFKRAYTYDSLGRAATETSTIDTTYVIGKTYDVYGRVDTLTYPTGVKVKNVYNAYGYLAEVHNGITNALFWKGNAKDALGNVINETLGNGLSTVRNYTATTGRLATITVGPNGTATIQNQTFYFDTLGNLSYRYDPIQGQTETFAYDALNRLTTATGSGTTVSVSYDSIGNITNKSDVGAYYYGKPHAVMVVVGTINANYIYDPNGNLTGGNGRSVIYTSFNMPSQISQGANTNDTFVYDADHSRTKQTTSSGTRIYLNPRIDSGAHFEKEMNGSTVTYEHYIYGASGVVGIYVTTGTATTGSTRYFHTDHLGSIVAVTDDAAAVIARYKYDAWGKRVPTAGDPTATHHGFTGHEQLDDVGLVNMNGRIYDPVLGRFMSADPYIQAPDNLQSYNRYSYVWNNPLSSTDPSGYWNLGHGLSSAWHSVWRNKAVRVVVAAVASYYTFGAVNGLFIYGGSVTASAAAGFVGGAIAGGDLKSAVLGGVTGGIFGAVSVLSGPNQYDLNAFQKIGANAVTGGVTTELQGGRFQDGFVSSGLSKSASLAYDSMVGRSANPMPGENRPDQTTYTPDPITGRQPFDSVDMNVVGNNDLTSFCRQGSTCSKFLNLVPGINATAGLHDYWFNTPNAPQQTALMNVGTMLPAAAITYTALVDGPLSVQLVVSHQR